MRIFQILPTIRYGDAVSNDTVALKKAIEEMGYETAIYADNIDDRMSEDVAENTSKMPKLRSDDVVIYHMAIGADMTFRFGKYKCRKVMIYHNVTPPHFFEQYSKVLVNATEYGLECVRYLADKVDYCIADSDFNKQNLIDMGYKCRIDVRPILIPFDDYKKQPSEQVVEKYSSDGYVNIVFVGRIAPNKKQEDVVRAFNFYKKNINPKSRLIFVGSPSGLECYYDRLQRYVEALELQDVIFTGHIKFEEILAFYKVADIFLCMSEHEGFCVPLVEAMFFEVPIIAYNSCAVPYTMGNSGLIVDTKDPAEIALLMDRIMNDEILKNNIIESQNKRLKDFSYESVKECFSGLIKNFIG